MAHAVSLEPVGMSPGRHQWPPEDRFASIAWCVTGRTLAPQSHGLRATSGRVGTGAHEITPSSVGSERREGHPWDLPYPVTS